MPTLRNEMRFRLAGRLAAGLVRGLHATWRVDVDDPTGVRGATLAGGSRAIFAFWHRHLLTMLAHHRRFPVCVPVSEHTDGEYAAQVMERFGLASVRGSTTHGSVKLLRGLMERVAEGWSLAITPDGPRGPRFTVQPGFALLSKRLGLPVYPVGVAVGRAITVPSWDRFVIPMPWTRLVISLGEALLPEDYGQARSMCPALARALSETTHRARKLLAPAPTSTASRSSGR